MACVEIHANDFICNSYTKHTHLWEGGDCDVHPGRQVVLTSGRVETVMYTQGGRLYLPLGGWRL